METTQAAKLCPWCAGALRLDMSYPVEKLFAGNLRMVEEREERRLPESLRTRPAWVCATSLCRYRELA